MRAALTAITLIAGFVTPARTQTPTFSLQRFPLLSGMRVVEAGDDYLIGVLRDPQGREWVVMWGLKELRP